MNSLTPRGQILYDTMLGIESQFIDKHINAIYAYHNTTNTSNIMKFPMCSHIDGYVKIESNGHMNIKNISYTYKNDVSDTDCLSVKYLNYNMTLYHNYNMTRHVNIYDDMTHYDYEANDHIQYMNDLLYG